jgi:hypothetical protein
MDIVCEVARRQANKLYPAIEPKSHACVEYW